MSCQAYIEQIHCYVDQELSSNDNALVERHLETCPNCREVYQELLLLRQALSSPVQFPEIAQKRMWRNLVSRKNRTWHSFIDETLDQVRTQIRDFDRRLVWSKLAAVPLSFCFFATLLFLFPKIPAQQWTYSAFMITPQVPQQTRTLPVMIHAVQSNSETNHLMEKIWRIPYEDSLSFVAEIHADGYAEIGDVLEYPRSPALLEAFDTNLRNAQFDMAEKEESPFVIYSFQKVDVYEGAVSAEAGL
jgi:hypothetical protein